MVLRRRIKKDFAVVDAGNPEQLRLSFAELTEDVIVYDYAVVVTSLTAEILTIAQPYRDRADCENPFDELNNRWGWGGFTTRDRKRCRFMARMAALVYNLWSLFVCLADPDQHSDHPPPAAAARPSPANPSWGTRITISHAHAEVAWVEAACREIATFFKTLHQTAEQFRPLQRGCQVLSRALVKYLNGRQLRPPPVLPAPA